MLVSPAFYPKYVHWPANATSPELCNNPKLYTYFRLARGAIDGSHFFAWVSDEQSGAYRSRKGCLS